MITPAYAAPGKDKVIERSETEGGGAIYDGINVEVPGVGTVIRGQIIVFESQVDETTDIDVFLHTEEGNLLSGFTTIDQDVFEVDNKFTSATLSPVTMEVNIFDPFNFIGTTEITIQATWEGTGDLANRKRHIVSDSDNFSVKFKGASLEREATAEVSINNANLGTGSSDDDIFLSSFKGMQMTVSERIIN